MSAVRSGASPWTAIEKLLERERITTGDEYELVGDGWGSFWSQKYRTFLSLPSYDTLEISAQKKISCGGIP